MITWYEILYAVNLISKRLQYNNMLINVSIQEVKVLIFFNFLNKRKLDSMMR